MRGRGRTTLTTTEMPQNGQQIIRRALPYLWPSDDASVRRRVVLALCVLFLAKIIAVGTPFFYKAAVDSLSGESDTAAWMLAIGAISLTVVYGLARLMTVGFNQLRDVIFAPVGQRALRQVAFETFQHMHRLSMRYHITRRTGGRCISTRARRVCVIRSP